MNEETADPPTTHIHSFTAPKIRAKRNTAQGSPGQHPSPFSRPTDSHATERSFMEDAGFREQQVRQTSRVQRQLLPQSPPDIAGYDIAGQSQPAHEVGGDYFDFIDLGEDRVALCLGDISGKGFPASLLMAVLQATIRALAGLVAQPKECVRRANKLLYNCSNSAEFASFFYAELDTKSHEMTFCNAGHNPPILFAEDENPRLLETGGLVLGAVKESRYAEERVVIDPGSTLLLYSDGITEATNADNTDFGVDRLKRTLHGSSESSEILMKRILQSVETHTGGSQHDDRTLVVVRRSP